MQIKGKTPNTALHQSDLTRLLSDIDYRPFGRDNHVWAKTVAGSAIHEWLEILCKTGERQNIAKLFQKHLTKQAEWGCEVVFTRNDTKEIVEAKTHELIAYGKTIIENFSKHFSFEKLREIGSEIGSEYDFLFWFEGVWIAGSVDLIQVYFGDNGSKIADFSDFKTHSKPLTDIKTTIQHDSYQLAGVHGRFTNKAIHDEKNHTIDFSQVQDDEWIEFNQFANFAYLNLATLAPTGNKEPYLTPQWVVNTQEAAEARLRWILDLYRQKHGLEIIPKKTIKTMKGKNMALKIHKRIKPDFDLLRKPGIIHGLPGSGKTTLGNQFPDAAFISIDPKGADHLENVVQVSSTDSPYIHSWQEFIDTVDMLLAEEKPQFKTIVIDTITTLYENLARPTKLKQLNIEYEADAVDDYGASWRKVMDSFLLPLKQLMNSQYNVVFLAHSTESDRPDNDKYKYWDIALRSKVADVLLRECSYCFFLNVDEKQNRMLYTEWTIHANAKARIGDNLKLPTTIKLPRGKNNYETIAHEIKKLEDKYNGTQVSETVKVKPKKSNQVATVKKAETTLNNTSPSVVETPKITTPTTNTKKEEVEKPVEKKPERIAKVDSVDNPKPESTKTEEIKKDSVVGEEITEESDPKMYSTAASDKQRREKRKDKYEMIEKKFNLLDDTGERIRFTGTWFENFYQKYNINAIDRETALQKIGLQKMRELKTPELKLLYINELHNCHVVTEYKSLMQRGGCDLKYVSAFEEALRKADSPQELWDSWIQRREINNWTIGMLET